MILNPFTEPVYIRLIEIDNNFATNIFNKMLFDNFYGWSETSLVFLKKEDEENDENVNPVLTFDVNLIIKLLEQLSAFNRYEDSINFYNANKNIENIINTYLNNLQIVDSKNFFEIKKAINKIKNINLYANSDNSKQYLNIKKEVINVFEQINNKSFNNSTKLNNSINNNTRLFSYNTKLFNYKNLDIKKYLKVNDTEVLNYYANDLNYKFKTQFVYSESNELKLENDNKIVNFKEDRTQKNIFANDIIRKIYFQKLKFINNNEKESINNIYTKNISRKKLYEDTEFNKKNIFNDSKYTEDYYVLNENISLINNIQLKQLIINTKFKNKEIEFYNTKKNEILNNIELKELINKDSFNSTYKITNSNFNISENNIINYKYLNEEIKSISKKYDSLVENSEITLSENTEPANVIEVSTIMNKRYILSDMNLYNEMFLYNGYNLKTLKNNTITLLNNNLSLENIIDKNILYKNLFSNMKVQDINSKIILKINKNTEENIFEKELLNYIDNYKNLLFQDVRELKEIIKEKYIIHNEEVNNKLFNSIKTKFNKEIIKKDSIKIYDGKTNKYLNKINEKKFIEVELLDKIKDIHIINEFKNKKNKILNIAIKENEILEKVINNKFTLNELQYEIKELKKEFIENIILKNLNSNLITNKNQILQQDKIYNELENNDKYYKENVIKSKNILYSKLLNNITNEDLKEYFKTTNLTYLKDISNLEGIEIFKNNTSNLPQGIKNIIKNIFLSNKYENNENSNESKIALNNILTKKLDLSDVENTSEKLKFINKSKSLINKNIYKSLSGNFTNEYIIKRFEKNNIIPKTLLNNSLMVQKIIDKRIVLNNITKYIKSGEIDPTRMLKIKKENIFEKELFVNIERYKDFLYKDIKELQQIIKYKFEVVNKENNVEVRSISNNELFNKEILSENNSYSSSVSLNNVSKETFNYKNILNKIENIKDYNAINEFNNKQRKLLNIIFKENELSEKIINNDITLTQLKSELKDVKDNFIKEILLKTVNYKVNKNKLIKHNEENEKNISELEKLNKNNVVNSTKSIVTHNKIEALELLSKNDIEFLKDTKLSYLKEIFASRETKELKDVIYDSETIIDLKNVVNKIGKNILINEDFKNNLITSLNKETNKKVNIKNILNETTQVRNLKSFINLVNNETLMNNKILINNERFIKKIKSLKINDKNYSFKYKNEINNISSTHSFAKHFLSKRFEKQNISSLKENLINSTINKNVELMQYENKNLEQQYSQDKLNYFNKNIERTYDENINMNYKREKKYSSNYSKEEFEIKKKYIDEEKLNKILNESIENILEKKINLKNSNNDENEKINYISKKVLSKIKKDLDYEKRKRGLF